MLVTVVGVKRNVSFSTKEGVSINGSNIYVEHLENGVEGYMAEKYFLNATTFDSSNNLHCSNHWQHSQSPSK